jgi:hypothetical protein
LQACKRMNRLPTQSEGSTFTGEIVSENDPSLHIIYAAGEERGRYYLKQYATVEGSVIIRQARKHPGNGDVPLDENMQPIPDGEYILQPNDAGVHQIKVVEGKLDEVSYNDDVVAQAILVFILVLLVVAGIIAMISTR